jgi:TonB family protein
MRSGLVHTIAAAALLSLSAFAQEPQQSKPCIATDERVYQPGIDGVKPPQPRPAKDAKDAPKMRGQVSLQLVVSSEGVVCSANVMATSDKLSAQEAAKYITQHWAFKPATKDGRPVAATFRMNLGPK